MDQQFRPLPSSSNTNCSVQAESLEGAAVNEVNELQKGALLANNDYDEEDCGCMLRTLEKDAFSTVVSAFRAQGMLTAYKEALLDHLKTALFISDAAYHAEIRRAANDELLSEVARTLNPSYDTYAQWGKEGDDPVPHYFSDIPLRDDIEEVSAADQLLRLANAHNARLHDENAALCHMIALPKAPYVPERLRLLLRETESDYEGRTDLLPRDEEDRELNSRAALDSIKTELVDASQQSSRIVNSLKEAFICESNQRTCYDDMAPSTSAARPNSLELATSCPSSSSSSTPIITSTDQISFTPQSTFQGDEELDPQISGESVRTRKRRLRQRDVTATCARVVPFRFQSAAPGQKSKPVRGNPDRRPPRQASPLGISNFTSASPITPSVTAVHSSHMTTPSPFRTVPPNSAAVINSGRLHQVPHLPTSGVLIKRARTLSSGGSEATSLEGALNYSRHSSSAQNMFKMQQPVQRAYIRSSSGQRFYASPIVSAYSNPARPYYGNPNAAVVGFMRSLSSSGPASSYTISSTPATHSQPQTITSSEIQRLVAQAAASGQPQQYRTAKRPLVTARPINLTGSRLSVVSQRQGTSPTASTFQNAAHLPGPSSGANALATLPSSGMQQQQQLTMHPAFRLTHRTVPSPAATALVPRAHTMLGTALNSSASFAHDVHLRHINTSSIQLQQHSTDDDTIAAVNSITQDNDEVLEQGRGSELDESMIAMNPDEIPSDGVRLECEEVLLPESRCVLPNYENDSANIQVAQLQQRPGEEISMIVSYGDDSRAERLLPEQYANGLVHQEGQNVVSYVTAPQCIQ